MEKGGFRTALFFILPAFFKKLCGHGGHVRDRSRAVFYLSSLALSAEA